MCEDGDVSRDEQLEEQVFEPGRWDVVRRLNEDIARVPDSEKLTGAELSHEPCGDMIVRAWNERQIDACIIDRILQSACCRDDRGAIVLVEPRQDMRRARNDRDALRLLQPRHVQGCRQVARTIVDAGKHMTMQIEHV